MRVCFVPNCNSSYNYRYCKEKVTIFSVPRDPQRFQEWAEAIPGTRRPLTSKDYVCEKHFASHMMIRNKFFGELGGEVLLGHLKKPALLPDAVPCIFPPPPQNLAENVSGVNKIVRQAVRNSCAEMKRMSRSVSPCNNNGAKRVRLEALCREPVPSVVRNSSVFAENTDGEVVSAANTSSAKNILEEDTHNLVDTVKSTNCCNILFKEEAEADFASNTNDANSILKKETDDHVNFTEYFSDANNTVTHETRNCCAKNRFSANISVKEEGDNPVDFAEDFGRPDNIVTEERRHLVDFVVSTGFSSIIVKEETQDEAECWGDARNVIVLEKAGSQVGFSKDVMDMNAFSKEVTSQNDFAGNSGYANIIIKEETGSQDDFSMHTPNINAFSEAVTSQDGFTENTSHANTVIKEKIINQAGFSGDAPDISAFIEATSQDGFVENTDYANTIIKVVTVNQVGSLEDAWDTNPSGKEVTS